MYVGKKCQFITRLYFVAKRLFCDTISRMKIRTKRYNSLSKDIEVKPETRFGRPVFVRTRVAVADVLTCLRVVKSWGYSEQYTKITLPQAKQAAFCG
jgi:uncharacterized protein (DUF433 family)